MSLLVILDSGEQLGSEVSSIDVIARDVIRVNFVRDMVVNSSYLDPSNYQLTPITGSFQIAVREILKPADSVKSANQVYIQTDKPLPNETFALSFGPLQDRFGNDVSVLADSTDNNTIYTRRTKTDSVLASIPSHFDKRPNSLIRNLLTAISLSDDQIGGSKDEPV